MAWNVEHHAARDDALGPVLDGAELGPVEGDLLLRDATIPHALAVPGVAERVDMGRGDAVIEDAVVVRGEAARATRQRLHVVLRRQRIAGSRLLRKRPAPRDRPAGL